MTRWRYLGVGACDSCDDEWVRLWSRCVEGVRAVLEPRSCATCWKRLTGERPAIQLLRQPSPAIRRTK